MTGLNRRVLVAVGLTLSLAMFADCGGDSGPTTPVTPTPIPTPAPTPVPTLYDGSWQGTNSSQGPTGAGVVKFTVASNQVTRVEFEIWFRDSGGFWCSQSGSVPSSTTITGNTFTVAFASSVFSTSISGQFNSTTTASGTFGLVTVTGATCLGGRYNGSVVGGTFAAAKS